MAILGTIALIALVILSILVLRVKSDPMEKASIRNTLAGKKESGGSPSSSLDSRSKPSS